jgi:Flp pilus assembly protein TadG
MRNEEQRMNKETAKRRVRGQAMVEVALMAPWILFLFIGVLSFGFFSYAAICTQNAARSAALANAATGRTDNAGACRIAINEMNSLPNTRSISSCNVGVCPSITGSVTDSQPLAVTSCAVAGPDGLPAVRVILTYRTLQMIPIPGVLAGKFDITRAVDAPILSIIPGAS